jgi:hypothetical protein
MSGASDNKSGSSVSAFLPWLLLNTLHVVLTHKDVYTDLSVQRVAELSNNINTLTIDNFAFCPQCIYRFHTILRIKNIISLHSVNQMVFVMVPDCVFFEVRTGYLNKIKTSFGFTGLK